MSCEFAAGKLPQTRAHGMVPPTSIPPSSTAAEEIGATAGSTGAAPRWFTWLAALALLGYALFLGVRTTAVAGGSDSSGYLNSARLLAEGRLQTILRLPPEFHPPTIIDAKDFTPLGFLPSTRPGQITPTYPTGLPLHFAAAAKLLGWRAGPLLVEVLAALAAVVLCYLTARRLGLAVWPAASGAIALAACPVFLFTSIQALSDTLATTWALGAFYCALRGRTSTGWAAVCGFAYSIAVLVRPTNLLFALPLSIMLGLHVSRLLWFVVAGLPAAAWLALYNNIQYGGPLESGYGDIASAFSTVYGVPTAIHFAKWLGLFLPSVLLVLPFAALAHPSTRSRAWLALMLGFGMITGLYLFYDVSHDVWWCLRFILPAVPFLILAGLLGIEALARRLAERAGRLFRGAAAVVLAAWAVAASCYWTPSLHVFLVRTYEHNYAEAALAARERLPSGALVVVNNFSGTMYFYTDFPVLRADVVEAEEFRRHAETARRAGTPICAILFDFEEAEAFGPTRCPGRWRKLSSLANVGFWQLESTAPP